MAAKLILQPSGSEASQQHYRDTILEPVPTTKILTYLNKSERDRLAPMLSLRKAIPAWGVVPGDEGVNAEKWDRIERGDLAVFAGDSKIFAAATVVEKVHNAALSAELWGHDDDGETWEYMYFLDDVRWVSIPYADFNRVMGYKPKNIIRGFNVLDEAKSASFLAAFELSSNTILPRATRAEYEQAIKTSPGPEATDREVKALARTEQGFLREQLFGGASTAKCCLCQRDLPVDLLVAAHIKRRSECNVEEKNDSKNVVAPMCKLGCDDLYERGYVSVDDSGQVVALAGAPSTPDLSGLIKQLVGRSCSAWRVTTKKYFRHHYDKATSQFK